MFYIQYKSQEKGMALVMALLYLAVISFLVISEFSKILLQTKINEHFDQQAQAFENAESALSKAEHSILKDQEQGEGEINADTSYKFHRQIVSECEIFYIVDAMATVSSANIKLQSIFVFPREDISSCANSLFVPHRVSWRKSK